MFCRNCGRLFLENETFCGACGTKKPVAEMNPPMLNDVFPNNYVNNSNYPNEPDCYVISNLISKMKTSSNIWLAIGIWQLIKGLATLLLGVGAITIALGVWNIVQSSNQRKNANRFLNSPIGITNYFGAHSDSMMFMLFNILVGSLFGIIGSIYDHSIDQYGKSNLSAIQYIERKYG